MDKHESMFDAVRQWAMDVHGHRPSIMSVQLDNGTWVQTPIPVFRPSEREAAAKRVTHSSEYREVVWYGIPLTFGAKQAKVFSMLHEAFESGMPDVQQQHLLRACQSDGTRLQDVFKRHPAWGTVIVPGEEPGSYRLVRPRNEE